MAPLRSAPCLQRYLVPAKGEGEVRPGRLRSQDGLAAALPVDLGDPSARVRVYCRVSLLVIPGAGLAQLSRSVLDRKVHAARDPVHVHHTKVVSGILRVDVPHLPKVPYIEHASPRPVLASLFDPLQRKGGLFFLRHAFPDQRLLREGFGGGVPAILVEPDSLLVVAIAFHDLALQAHARKVEFAGRWRVVGRKIHPKGIG